MPRGSKKSYSSKQKRMASHIEKSSKRKGRSTKTAERIAWASVNKQTGGGAKKRSAKSRSHKKASHK
jgi:hypothetical protein